MGDVFPSLRLAAVQAAPVLLDREASVEKACALIAEAGSHGATVVGFPEGFIPSHPLWMHLFQPDDSRVRSFNTRLFLNAVEVPGPATRAIGEAARKAGCHVVMGVCEKAAGSFGTMYNTLLFFGPDGRLLGKHQKLVPTGKEKLVHTMGRADTFDVVPTEWGALGGLMCAENQNNLARHGVAALGETVHVASWPAFFGMGHHGGGVPSADVYDFTVRSHAYSSRVFVISSAGAVDDETVAALGLEPDGRAFLESMREKGGGSAIIHPSGRRLAGPLLGKEGILYADATIEDVIAGRVQRDLTGNYNRFDIFHFAIDRRAPTALRVLDAAPESNLRGGSALASGTRESALPGGFWTWEESASSSRSLVGSSEVTAHPGLPHPGDQQEKGA